MVDALNTGPTYRRMSEQLTKKRREQADAARHARLFRPRNQVPEEATRSKSKAREITTIGTP